MAQLPFASGPEKTFVPENTQVLEKTHIPERTRIPEKTRVLERIVSSVARPVDHAVPFSVSLCGLRRRGGQCRKTHFPLAYSLSCHIPFLSRCCLVWHLPSKASSTLILASGSTFQRTLAKICGHYISLGLCSGLHAFHRARGVF